MYEPIPAPRFCSSCGARLTENARFCSSCGASVCGTQMSGIESCANALSVKEQTSGIIWIVIAVLQIIIGCTGQIGILIIGVLNIISGVAGLKQSKKVLTPYPGLVQEYETQLIGLIITLLYNLFIGGVIGVAGTVYEFTIRSYVLKNRAVFESVRPV